MMMAHGARGAWLLPDLSSPGEKGLKRYYGPFVRVRVRSCSVFAIRRTWLSIPCPTSSHLFAPGCHHEEASHENPPRRASLIEGTMM